MKTRLYIVLFMLIACSVVFAKNIDAFSKDDLSCELRLKNSTVKEGYPVGLLLTIYNKSDVPVTIAHSLYHIGGNRKVLTEQGGEWIDLRSGFDWFEGYPYDHVTIQGHDKTVLGAYITETYKMLPIGITKLKMKIPIYIVDKPGFVVPLHPISCRLEAEFHIIECDPKSREADIKKLVQDILNENDEKSRDDLIRKLISFADPILGQYIHQVWNDPGCCKWRGAIAESLLSFDQFETDFVLVNLPESAFVGNAIDDLLSKRETEWIANLIEIPQPVDLSRNHILEVFRAELVKKQKKDVLIRELEWLAKARDEILEKDKGCDTKETEFLLQAINGKMQLFREQMDYAESDSIQNESQSVNDTSEGNNNNP